MSNWDNSYNQQSLTNQQIEIKAISNSIATFGIYKTLNDNSFSQNKIKNVLKEYQYCPLNDDSDLVQRNWIEARLWLKFTEWWIYKTEINYSPDFLLLIEKLQNQAENEIDFLNSKLAKTKTELEIENNRSYWERLKLSYNGEKVKTTLKDIIGAFGVNIIVFFITITISGAILMNQVGWSWKILNWWKLAFTNQKSVIAISVVNTFFLAIWFICFLDPVKKPGYGQLSEIKNHLKKTEANLKELAATAKEVKKWNNLFAKKFESFESKSDESVIDLDEMKRAMEAMGKKLLEYENKQKD